MNPLPRLLLAACLLRTSVAVASLQVQDLRCDWATDPAGIDSEPPQLAWKIRSDAPGVRQAAWQVRVASTRAKFDADDSDVWDSGRQAGDAQFQVRYDGRALRTAEQVFWQVRIWDQAGNVSPWSEPASWTMGVVRPEDWKAQWITDPTLLDQTRQKLGFSTPAYDDAHKPQWIILDLGQVFPIEQIALHALTHTVNERLGFPQRFKIELSQRADFSDAVVVMDHTDDPINPWLARVTVPVKGGEARYLRLSVPELRMMEEDHGGRPRGRLALSQIEVRSGGANVAAGAAVTASASLEEGPWSKAAVVDGKGLPGANPRAASTLRLRHEFDVARPLRRATLFVSGLGHYTLGLNGTPVAEENRLKPGWTDYTKTVLYDTFDVTAQLQAGRNALGLTLASGMYNVPYAPGRYTKFVGPPRALMAIAQLRLEYGDGQVDWVTTNEHWKTAPGPATFAHVYGGEDYDAARTEPGWDRPGFDDGHWINVVPGPDPGGRLRGASRAGPSLAFHETLTPVRVNRIRPNLIVYDLGQNAAVIPHLRVRGPAGSTVKILPSELVHADGTIDPRSTHSNQTEAGWNYRLAGAADGEAWTPSFFYHGARYLQVELTSPSGTALPVIEQLDGRVLHSSAPAIGHFACSNDLLNRIRALIRWAQRSNLVHVMTDCPHRERLGWLEQYHLNGPALRSEFDLTRLFAKGLGDMADAQLPNGLVPSIAPEYVRFDGYFRDSPEWGSAFILAAEQQLTWSGDDTSLVRHYDGMRRYLEYLGTRAEGQIVSHGLGDWYDIGPKPPGVSQLTPIPLVATATYFQAALAMERIARRLGRSTEAERYRQAAEQIAAAFEETFFDATRAIYATGSQTAQAMPLALGLAPDAQREAVLAQLVQAVRQAGNVATAGDVGHRYLLLALAEGGRSDLIYEILNQTDQPGYAYQLARGATSLTEAWDANPRSSQNHFMLGHLMEWFYQHLAGLSPDPAQPGFGRIIIRPEPVGDVKWAEASLDTVRGEVAVRWDRTPDTFRLELSVPANAVASVQLPFTPDRQIYEGGEPVEARARIVAEGTVRERPTFTVGSGRYVFEVR